MGAAWETFEEKDYEERLAFVEEILGDDARMDEENAFQMFIALYDESFERGERPRVTALLDRFAEAQPETYAAEAPYLFDLQLKTAAATDGLDALLEKRADVGGLGGGFRAHRVAAAVEAVPRWLAFVHAQGLLGEQERDAALQALSHMAEQVERPLRQFSEDTHLPGAVAAAWEKSAA